MLTVLKGRMGTEVQYLLFSATFDEKVMPEIQSIGTTYKEIRVDKTQIALPNIKQYFIAAEQGAKIQKLSEIIQAIPTNKLTIVFVNTVKFAKTVCYKIK
jgi:superfamily II DNA/RNA helicase